MNKESHLLPWILGGLLVATVAIAITAVSIQNINSRNLRVRNITADPSLSLPATSLALASPAALPIPALSTAAPPAAPVIAEPAVLSLAETPSQMTAPRSEPSGQIWECTTNGVRTFSNNPCGDKSTLREMGPINTMNATPPVRYVPASGPDPRYAPENFNEGAYAEQDAYSEPVAAESHGDSYAVIQGFAYLPRWRAEHPHRPIHHHPGKPVRRN